MKKYLSVLLTVAMLVSLVTVFATNVNAIGEGEWNVYARRGAYENADEFEIISTPGYEYTADGLHMIPPEYSDTDRAWGIIQTKDQVDLRQGVYMEVRVDDFTYEGDKWFGFNIWEERIDEFPNENDKQPLGFEALLRPNDEKNVASLQLNSHTSAGASIDTAGASASEFENKHDENGCPILTLQITWSETEGYAMILNGLAVSQSYCDKMTQFFDGEDNDGLAYLSFSLQTGAKNGTVECTVLKFGTSPEDCSIPVGTDSAEPVSSKIEIAPIADPDSVPYGEPAVFLNGSPVDSHIHVKPRSTNNSTITVKNDGSINVMTTTGWASVSMSVAYDVSYDAAQFPVMMIIARNMCTCSLTDEKPICQCVESPTVFALAGDTIAERNDETVKAVSYMFEPYTDDDGNVYVCYFADWYEYSGRINGFRIDLHGVKYTEEGRNSFDICNVAFFRDYDEADAFFEDYLTEIGVIESEDETETESATETETEMETDTEEVTENATEETTQTTEATETEAPTDEETLEETFEETDTEATTGEDEVTETPTTETPTEAEKPTEAHTNAPQDNSTDGSEDDEGGCGSTLGLGAALVIAVSAAAAVCFKKRED